MNDLVAKNISHYIFLQKSTIEILQNISFSIDRGEFVSLLGPSGCGKTTLLSIIAGLITPTDGTIQRTDKMGYMLQEDFLFPWKSIGENCALGLQLTNTYSSESKDYIGQLLAQVGLENTENMYPNQLSGGMRQRVALVRTLVTNPQLLLLDEPFSALDYQNKLKLEEIVFQLLNQSPKTTVLVTHDIEEAIAMSHRIFVLSVKPSTIKKMLEVPLEIRNLSPLEARKHPDFSMLREEIWKELNVLEPR